MGCKGLDSSRAHRHQQQQQQQQRPADVVTSERAQQLPVGGSSVPVLQQLQLPLLLLLVVVLMLVDTTGASLDDKRKIVEIRSSIVEALGLQRIPDPAKANVSQAEYERAHKEYLTRLRRSAEGDARQRRLFTMYATDETTREGITLSFPLSVEDPDSALVESATLRLLLDHDEDAETAAELEIRVYRRRGSGARRWLLSRRPVPEPETARRRWLEFDLTEELAAALSLYSEQPLQLLVQLLRKNNLRETWSPARGLSVSSAALNVHAFYPEGEDRTRRRRSLGSPARDQLMSLHRGKRTECRGEAKKCCRHRMTVIFKDLEGFDFIIQPKSFDAGYCKGRCPPRYNPAHHHALLQSLIWKEDRKKAPRPCCAPSKLAELEILYFDENDTTKLKVSNWKDMRVLECACS